MKGYKDLPHTDLDRLVYDYEEVRNRIGGIVFVTGKRIRGDERIISYHKFQEYKGDKYKGQKLYKPKT